MKNLNTKGFFMIETIAVIGIAATILVILYSQINLLFSNYERNAKYNTVESIYAVCNIKTYIDENYMEDLLTDLTASGPMLDITDYYFDSDDYYDSLVTDLNIRKVYFTPYNINNVITNYADYDINASFLNYLKTIKVSDDKTDTYRIIVILNSDEYASVYFQPPVQ